MNNTTNRPGLGLKKALLLLSVVTSVCVGIAFAKRDTILAHYWIHQFAHAEETEALALAPKIAECGPTGRQLLIEQLADPSPANQRLAQHGLISWIRANQLPEQPADEQLLSKLVQIFPNATDSGKTACMECAIAFWEVTRQAHPTMNDLLEAGLRELAPNVKLRSISLAIRMSGEHAQLVAPLLADADVFVRRAALLAVGPVQDGQEAWVPTEELLPLIHDADPQLAKLAQQVLRGRGLPQRDIDLSWRLTHPDATERLNFLLDLPSQSQEEEFDPTPWIAKLSLDRDAAVRAGAARVAGERKLPLEARLRAMSQEDPNKTVREVAEYYRKKLEQK